MSRSWTNGWSQLLSPPPPLRPLEAQQRRLCLAEGHGGRSIETSERAHEKGRLTGQGGWGGGGGVGSVLRFEGEKRARRQ